MLSLLLNADLFDPSPRGRAHLLVAGESIVWIGTEKPSLPKGLAREWDLGGRRVIPGLIDGHVHLTGGGGEAGPHTRVPPVALSRLTLGGVTTAVGRAGHRRRDPHAGGAGRPSPAASTPRGSPPTASPADITCRPRP